MINKRSDWSSQTMSLGFKYAALMQRYYEGNSQLDSARYMVGTAENERPKKVGGLNRQSCSARKRSVDNNGHHNIFGVKRPCPLSCILQS
jgi:hypothetical protein